MKRVVNINFKCEGLDFDAAIDCDNVLKETLKEERDSRDKRTTQNTTQ